MELNEKPNSKKKECLCLLNDIHENIYNQLNLEDQMDEIKEQYQK